MSNVSYITINFKAQQGHTALKTIQQGTSANAFYANVDVLENSHDGSLLLEELSAINKNIKYY